MIVLRTSHLGEGPIKGSIIVSITIDGDRLSLWIPILSTTQGYKHEVITGAEPKSITWTILPGIAWKCRSHKIASFFVKGCEDAGSILLSLSTS